MRKTLAVVAVCLAVAGKARTQETFLVPHRAPPTIDGVLTPSEWSNAGRGLMDDGSELLLQHDGSFLYIGIRAKQPGFPSLCVAAGDTLRILHASAALGSAEYVRRDDGAWALRSGFDWTMREADSTAATRAKRAVYLSTHGWLANTVQMSEQGKEMQVRLSHLGASDIRIGLAYYIMEGARVAIWPRAMRDACRDLKLVQGEPPLNAPFDRVQWASLQLGR